MLQEHIEMVHQDARGWIADVLEDEPVEHVTLLSTRRGGVRGNHVHHATHQWLYVISGALRYVVRTEDGFRKEGVLRDGDLLLTGPNEAHAFQAEANTLMMAFTRGPRGGREYESDTFRLDEPLIAPSESTDASAGS